MTQHRLFQIVNLVALISGTLFLLWGRPEGLLLVGGAGGIWLLQEARARRRRRHTVGQIAQQLRRLTRGEPVHSLRQAAFGELAPLVEAWNALVETLPKRLARLSHERDLWRGVLDYISDGALVVDERGAVQWINRTASQMLNVPPEASRNPSLATLVHHHRIIHLWQRSRDQHDVQEDTVELEGGKRTLRVRVVPLRPAEERAYLVLLQDLTYLRQLETTRRDFVSNISHELRTPLASLKAVVETLRHGALEDPHAAQRFLAHIEREVDTMIQIVEELLELARIESGQVPLRLVTIPVEELVRPVVERFHPQAERAGLDLRVELPSTPLHVLADPPRAQRILANLLHNAIKFTPSGGNIRVRATPQGQEEVLFTVSDTGVGIPSDKLPRIFERFYKVDRARTGEGTGLGLAIAKHLTLAHGGRIWVESTEGKGSTFYFTLRQASPPS